MAKTVEWAANIGSSIASIFGWSKPRLNEPQTIITSQTLRYAGVCDGPEVAIPGGLSCLNRLETIDYGSYTNEDEMSLPFLYSVPYYSTSISWSAGAGQGTSLLSKLISPNNIITTDSDTVAGHTLNYEYHVPFTYLSRAFRFWRGSIKVTLKFVKTQMHSGRLQVTWTPCTTVSNTPSQTTGVYSLRTIIDIREEEVVSLELPYLMYSDYLATSGGSQPSSSGQLDIIVLNDLRGPESVSQTIQMQVFYSAGDDYELAVPTNFATGSTTYIPQSNGDELVIKSVDQGAILQKVAVGGKSTKHNPLWHATRCIGEKLMSIKSLLLKNSIINSFKSGFVWTSANNMEFFPFFVPACNLSAGGLVSSVAIGGDAYSFLAPMYAFYRGAANFTIFDAVSNTNTFATGVNPGYDFSSQTQPLIENTLLNSNMFWGTTISPVGGQGQWPFNPSNILDRPGLGMQHVPYYNRFPMSLVTLMNGVDTPLTDPSTPIGWGYTVAGSNFSTQTILQRHMGDDFQLMFFIGCPPIPVSYS
jgi:hypothetical protein